MFLAMKSQKSKREVAPKCFLKSHFLRRPGKYINYLLPFEQKKQCWTDRSDTTSFVLSDEPHVGIPICSQLLRFSLFLQVNSDKIYWQRNTDGTFKQIYSEKKTVGHSISTKAVGSDERTDITHLYKHPEGINAYLFSKESRIDFSSALCIGLFICPALGWTVFWQSCPSSRASWTIVRDVHEYTPGSWKSTGCPGRVGGMALTNLLVQEVRATKSRSWNSQ